MLDILLDTLIDSLKILPFLFATYLIIEYIAHISSGKIFNNLRKYGIVGGALLGSFPQCGFAVAAANLYTNKLISAGTLIAAFVSTSDEAIPVLIANSGSLNTIIKLIVTKIIIAIIAGLIVDYILRKFLNESADEHKKIIKTHHSHHDHNIAISALKHTAQIFVFILLTNLLLNLVIGTIGEDNLSKVLLNDSIFQPALAAVIGFIPNCASSIVLTQLYLAGNLSFGSAVAGLSTGAGIGLIVLFKVNKNVKENIKIMLFLYVFSVIAGSIIQLIG